MGAPLPADDNLPAASTNSCPSAEDVVITEQQSPCEGDVDEAMADEAPVGEAEAVSETAVGGDALSCDDIQSECHARARHSTLFRCLWISQLP